MAGRDLKLARLAFDIEANTKGLKGELDSAERSFGRLAKFVTANPVASLGALAAAAVAAGAAAVRMAADFDASARRVAASIPNGTASLVELRKVAEQLSIRRGLSTDTIFGGLEAVAKEGVTDLGALIARFEVLQDTADATGTSVANLAGPFDQILDVFGLTDDQLRRVAARLAAISQARGVGFEDLIGSFQAAAPVIRGLGLSFDDAANALSALLAQGLTTKQGLKEVKDAVAELGRDGLLALAKDAAPTGDELERLAERSALAAGGIDRLNQSLANYRDAQWRALGQSISDNLNGPLTVLLGLLTDPVVRAAFASGGFNAAAGAVYAQTKAKAGAAGGPFVETQLAPPKPLTGPDGKPIVLPELSTADSPEVQGKIMAAQRRAAEQLAEELHRVLVKATATANDDLQAVIDGFVKKFQAAGPFLTDAQRRQFDFLLGALREARDLQLDPEVLKRTLETPLSLRGVDNEELQRQADYIAERREREAKAAKEAADQRERERQAVRQQADAIQRGARAAAQLAAAFGLLDANAAASLESIATIASEVEVIAKNGFSFDSAFSIAGGVASLFSGLFTESPDARRDRELREQNTEAIRELTKTFKDQLSGRSVTDAQRAVQALRRAGAGLEGAANGIGGEPGLDRGAATRIIRSLGIEGVTSLRDLQDLIAEIDPNLKLNTSSYEDFRDSLKQVQQAIDAVNFRAFVDSFAGQLERLQVQFDLFDITNPLDQLEKLRELAGSKYGSPALDAALGGLNLQDPAQRAEAERRLLELVQQASSGAGLSAEQLGGMSSAELIDLIRQIEALIDQVNEQQGTATGGGPLQQGFSVERKITDVQADRMISLAISQDAHLIEIRDLLARALPVAAPILPAVLAAGGAIELVLNVTVEGPVSGENATAVGETLGLSAADAMARALGARLLTARARAGDVLVTR